VNGLFSKILDTTIEIDESQLDNIYINTPEGRYSISDYLVYKIVKVIEVMNKNE
jgi:hypothetical protein